MFKSLYNWLIVSSLFVALVACVSQKEPSINSNSTAVTNIDAYNKQKADLKQKDRDLYFSASIRLNEQEQELDKIMSRIQRKQLDKYQAEHFFPPARNFYQSKKHIEEDQLYKILKSMPKGGALHLHALAMGEAEWIIEKAISLPEMYVYWSDEDGQSVKGQFQAFKESEVTAGYVQVKQLCQIDPQARERLHSYLVFDETIDQDSVDIWKEFEFIFQRVTGVLRYEPVFSDYLAHACGLLVEDNIQHAELRMPFANYLYTLDNPPGSLSIEHFVGQLEKALAKVRKTDPHFTMKVIHQNLRFRSTEEIRTDINEVIKMTQKYPNWLLGYDLVAEEDAGHNTSFHVEEFLRLDQIEKAKKVHLPLFLHDGESNWTSSDNLYDAVLLGTKRIGHGFNLFRFPSLIDKVIEEDICIEINPLSNQILGYIRDLRNHPASTYLRRGINCTISSDDPLIFDYEGLSYDYWNIYMAWELDLAAVKKLSQNGITYSALNTKEKQQALKVWEERWNKFVTQTLERLKK